MSDLVLALAVIAGAAWLLGKATNLFQGAPRPSQTLGTSQAGPKSVINDQGPPPMIRTPAQGNGYLGYFSPPWNRTTDINSTKQSYQNPYHSIEIPPYPSNYYTADEGGK